MHNRDGQVKSLSPDKLLSMINAIDEKVDDLALATQQSFQALGADTMKLAVQVISIYRLLIERGLTTEEDFKQLFTETAASMQAHNLPDQGDDELADIEI